MNSDSRQIFLSFMTHVLIICGSMGLVSCSVNSISDLSRSNETIPSKDKQPSTLTESAVFNGIYLNLIRNETPPSGLGQSIANDGYFFIGREFSTSPKSKEEYYEFYTSGYISIELTQKILDSVQGRFFNPEIDEILGIEEYGNNQYDVMVSSVWERIYDFKSDALVYRGYSDIIVDLGNSPPTLEATEIVCRLRQWIPSKPEPWYPTSYLTNNYEVVYTTDTAGRKVRERLVVDYNE